MGSEEEIHKDYPPRATSALSNYNTPSSRFSFSSSSGRPLAQGPRTLPIRKNVTPSHFYKPRNASPNAAYRESAQRRVEKEEARSLRDALEEMDQHDELRIHQAAQDEATELVWMHQNPDSPHKNPYAPYRNPDIGNSRQDHRKPGRSQRQGLGNQRGIVPSQRENGHRSVSETSSDSCQSPATENAGAGFACKKVGQRLMKEDGPGEGKNGAVRKNLKVNFALPSEEVSSKPEDDNQPRPRNVSSDSSKGIFRNPNDQIYEEPKGPNSQVEDSRPLFARSDPSALRTKPRNSLLQGSRPLPNRSSNPDFAKKLSRFEIHRNPPSQSRNPQYKMNEPHSDLGAGGQKEEEPIPTKDGIEVRGDDIRAATSKRLKDRSERLPTPSAVSDRAGRPIVSFDPTWKPGEAQPKDSRDTIGKRESTSASPSAQPEAPPIQVSEAPCVPVINLPGDKEPTISELGAPSIQVSEAPSVPVINLPDDKEPTISEKGAPSKTRGVPPDPRRSFPRRDTFPKKPAPTSSDNWYSPYSRAGVPTARCEYCSLPIAGKIVTAAGSRLHPECFTCSHCRTPLECVAFYQEPEAKRNERLAKAATDDEEAWAPRFYCHLDFHELFSPRCKSCKTPIEGEVVVACGAEWHVGHFFCAECGDVWPISLVQ